VRIKGPKGELEQWIDPCLEVKFEEGEILVSRSTNHKDERAKHGLYRSLLNNMVEGVTNGYEKKLELVGVGYRATNQGQILQLSLGYSHPIHLELPPEISVKTETEKGKNPIVTLQSIDKQLVGAVASKIRSLRKPEPYKGKGVKYVGEYIRRKAGKAAAK
ncbi:MAG: 50S ribosomal protein L6, partial [Flavobacteriales bacterium]|nr:50S ribosomal protein L6 [Flavobacteriales bacterium]